MEMRAGFAKGVMLRASALGRPGRGTGALGGSQTARRWRPRRQRARRKPSCRRAGPKRGASSIGPPSARTTNRAGHPVVIWVGRMDAAALRRLRTRMSVTGSISRTFGLA
jgi:hypothetical protein